MSHIREKSKIMQLLHEIKKTYDSIPGGTDLSILISGNSIHINNRLNSNVKIDLHANVNLDHIEVIDLSEGKVDRFDINLEE